MKRIAVFASGRGSNARKIVSYFKDKETGTVALIVSNRQNARVLDLAEEENIPSLVIHKQVLYDSEEILDDLEKHGIDVIVLAGFLWLIPDYLIRKFEGRIVNIHPALLPKYGGKGMYGKYVHEAVWKAKEQESGITIHLVNEVYDEGKILFQASCQLSGDDSPDDIAARVLELEHKYYPEIVEKLLLQL